MKINYLSKNILFGFVILILIIVWAFAFSTLAKHLNFWLALSLPLVVFLITTYFIKRTNNFISGFLGEHEVGDGLKGLGSDYIIINKGLENGHGNIDKIIIGPTGVWTLEVKSQKVNSIVPEPFLNQAYAEAKYLESFIKSKINLDLHVQPVLVFSNKYAKVRYGLTPQRGVYVIQKEWLSKLLVEIHAQNLDGATILKIKESLQT